MRTFKFGMTTFDCARTICNTGFTATTIGGCGVEFSCEFFGCVLLWLSFSCHGFLIWGILGVFLSPRVCKIE